MVRDTKSRTASNSLLLAVLVGLPAVVLASSSSASAQYRIPADGHLLDRNPQFGSGGSNGAGTNHNNYNVNNNIVTGNVSGLNYFHGNNTGEFDPHTFAGQTGSSSFDSFNYISAPQNYAQRSTGAPTYAPVYSTGSSVGLSNSNFVATPGGTTYVAAPKSNALTPKMYDSRLDQPALDPIKGDIDGLPASGVLSVAGPVDPSGSQSMYTMSPLYGVRKNEALGTESQFFNPAVSANRTGTLSGTNRLDPTSIQRMRDELNSANPNGDQAPGNGTDKSAPTVPGAVDVNQGAQLNPISTNGNNLTGTTALNSTVNGQKLGADLQSGESLQSKLIIPASKQSKQLQELERRYKKSNEKLNDVEAAQRLNEELRAQKAATPKPTEGKMPVVPGPLNPNEINPGAMLTDPTKPGASSATPVVPGTSGKTGEKTGEKPEGTSPDAPKAVLTKPAVTPGSAAENQPYVITSLSTGIDAKGLADLMKTAEDRMRQGKFTEAVDNYDTAEQVAPNNPFVRLGRGFAELGASYYGKADLDLNRAIKSNPEILVGRYDLKGFLGEDKVSFVQKDLQDIADHEKGARPLVLLAYLRHNIGDDTTAAANLTEAEKRGGYNELIKLMRDAWNLK